MICGSQLTWLTGSEAARLSGCGTAGDPASSPRRGASRCPSTDAGILALAGRDDDEADAARPSDSANTDH